MADSPHLLMHKKFSDTQNELVVYSPKSIYFSLSLYISFFFFFFLFPNKSTMFLIYLIKAEVVRENIWLSGIGPEKS